MKIELNANELNMVLKGLDKYINDCLESAANADSLRQNILNASVDSEKPIRKEDPLQKQKSNEKYREKERLTDKYRNIHERRKWMPEEDLYLKAYYGNDNTSDIAAHLERSRAATRQRAMVLGLTKKGK